MSIDSLMEKSKRSSLAVLNRIPMLWERIRSVDGQLLGVVEEVGRKDVEGPEMSKSRRGDGEIEG